MCAVIEWYEAGEKLVPQIYKITGYNLLSEICTFTLHFELRKVFET